MSKTIIHTEQAPAAIGTYSQAARVGNLVFISGQLPLNPQTMELETEFEAQTRRVFDNLAAICQAAGGSLANLVKVNIFLVDLTNFATVNSIMAEYFDAPYPARAAVQVVALPKGADIEIEAIFAD